MDRAGENVDANSPRRLQAIYQAALKTWRGVRANQAEANSPLARRADAAIKRLSR
jgi:hypothetical protein